MWARGLSVTLPRLRAVWSPHRDAIQACAASCRLNEKSKTAICMAMTPMSSLVRKSTFDPAPPNSRDNDPSI